MTDTQANQETNEGFAPSYVDGADDEVNTEVEGQADDDDSDQLSDEDDEGSYEDEGEQEEEFEEVERGGKKYKVPKALASELMMDADYRRKTMAHAEEARALEAEKLAFKATSKEIDDAAFELKALERREADLSALSRDDWALIKQMDVQNGTNRYDELMREFQTLPKQKDDVKSKLDAKTQEVAKTQQEITAKQISEGHAVLTRDIPGWGPELGAKLTEFVAKEYGITAEKHGEAFMDPAIIKLAHAAYKARADTRKATTADVAAKANAIKPVPTARGGGAPTRDPNKMSAKEYADYRDKQVGPGR